LFPKWQTCNKERGFYDLGMIAVERELSRENSGYQLLSFFKKIVKFISTLLELIATYSEFITVAIDHRYQAIV